MSGREDVLDAQTALAEVLVQTLDVIVISEIEVQSHRRIRRIMRRIVYE